LIGLVDLPEGPRIASIIHVENPLHAAIKEGDEAELVVGKTEIRA